MKTRVLILAATIAAATASLTTPTAQACVINPDGECMRPVADGPAIARPRKAPADHADAPSETA